MTLAPPLSWSETTVLATTLASAAILILAAGHDIVSRTVPNWMSLAIGALGIPASFAAGWKPEPKIDQKPTDLVASEPLQPETAQSEPVTMAPAQPDPTPTDEVPTAPATADPWKSPA